VRDETSASNAAATAIPFSISFSSFLATCSKEKKKAFLFPPAVMLPGMPCACSPPTSGPSNASDPKVEGPFFYFGTNEQKSTGRSTAEDLNAFKQAYANGSEADVVFLTENKKKPGVVNVPNLMSFASQLRVSMFPVFH
jgi:hypothetical protein